MRLHVMHGHGGNVQTPCESASERSPNQQGPLQAGAGGVGDAVEVTEGGAALRQGGAHQRRNFAHMVPRGQFRHYAAKGRMLLHLAVQQIGEQARSVS